MVGDPLPVILLYSFDLKSYIPTFPPNCCIQGYCLNPTYLFTLLVLVVVLVVVEVLVVVFVLLVLVLVLLLLLLYIFLVVFNSFHKVCCFFHS